MTRRRLSPQTSFFPAVLLALGLVAACPGRVPAQGFPTTPGSLDPTFLLNGGADLPNPAYIPNQYNFTPFALAVQPLGAGNDDQVIIGGDNGTLFRVFLQTTDVTTTATDGTLVTTTYGPGEIDNAFFASTNQVNGFGNDGRIVFALATLPDGRVLVGGRFGVSFNSQSFLNQKEVNFIRLNPDGRTEVTLDENGTATALSPFNANLGNGANDPVLAILPRAILAAGETEPSVLVGGQFQRFNKQDRGRLVQLNPDGTSDQVFNTNIGSGASGIVFNLAEGIGFIPDPVFNFGSFGFNGQAYVCGDYDTFNGKGPGKLVRLNADGTWDTTFAPKITGRAIAVAVQPADGKVLVGGDLDAVNGTAVNNLARLNLDGSLDTTFAPFVSLSIPNNIPPTSVYVIRVQADGRILVGGNYQQVNGVTRRYLSRLLPDGTLDLTFDATNALVRTEELFRSPNAVQAIVPSFTTLTDGNGVVTGTFQSLVIAQTRADRKIVPGDNGRFLFPVNRIFTDDAIPAPPVSLTAAPENGPRFRVTRSGNLSQPVRVTVKVASASTAQFGVDYDLFPAADVNAGIAPGAAALGSRFTVTIPAGSASADVIVFDRDASGKQVKLKIIAPTDGSYTRVTGASKAVVNLIQVATAAAGQSAAGR